MGNPVSLCLGIFFIFMGLIAIIYSSFAKNTKGKYNNTTGLIEYTVGTTPYTIQFDLFHGTTPTVYYQSYSPSTSSLTGPSWGCYGCLLLTGACFLFYSFTTKPDTIQVQYVNSPSKNKNK